MHALSESIRITQNLAQQFEIAYPEETCKNSKLFIKNNGNCNGCLFYDKCLCADRNLSFSTFEKY